MADDNMVNHYMTNWLLSRHRISLTEVNEMLPFERVIYMDLLKQELQAEERREKNSG